MIDYRKDIATPLRQASQLMGEEMRKAINDMDCEGLEERMEQYFEMIRRNVRLIRVFVAEEWQK